jgi:hypothetical protein
MVLQVQLEKLGILSFVRIEEVPTLDSLLKNVWADNADIMSKQYTGTGALKTDYTRTGTSMTVAPSALVHVLMLLSPRSTGRRSVRGTITDGVNSTKRFMNKNFKDEEKQISSDLFLGRFRIERRRYDELFQFDGASNSYYIASYYLLPPSLWSFLVPTSCHGDSLLTGTCPCAQPRERVCIRTASSSSRSTWSSRRRLTPQKPTPAKSYAWRPSSKSALQATVRHRMLVKSETLEWHLTGDIHVRRHCLPNRRWHSDVLRAEHVQQEGVLIDLAQASHPRLQL